MSIYKELSFENDIESIKAIQFTVMSPQEIENKSVCEIVSTDTYSGNDPIIGGLFDSRMGVIENDKICKTCNQKNTFCPGHFGHIKLAKPVFYIQFFDIVRKILKCVCFRCSRLLMDSDDPMLLKMMNKKFPRQKRFEYVYKCCSKIKRCGQENKDGCGAKLPQKTIKENIGKIVMEWKDEDIVRKNVYNAEDILIILKRITDDDSTILGFPPSINRPENLVCTVFPVPPPSVRPSVRNDTGQRCEDDLTHKLCDIIKTNNTLRQKIEKEGTNPDQIDYWYILLQFHIATFVDNQLPGIPPAKQRTGRPLRSLTERLKSKEGRIRGNLMGKRVDFSARSVITPDPNIDLDELGVPIKIAMNLTFPEIVNAHNINEMYKLVKNGNDVYPGAKYVRKNDDGKGYRTIRLKNINRDELVLNYGDIVDRHLRNGDYVLFNRQPSLHKMSMMAHRVRVMPYDTFRLNVCCTPSYNADYDGDEMNMHVPQSSQTEYELKSLASVPTQIISPRESSPIISVVQDIVVGLYRITKNNVNLNNKQYFNILAGNTKFTGTHLPHSKQINGARIWTGHEMLSSVMNPLINLSGGNNLNIVNGVIKSGQIDKRTYQNMTYGLIHYVYNELGDEECKALFDNTQRLICDWLVYNGFSVGISDLIVNDSTQEKINNVVNELKVNVYNVIRDIHMNTFENSSIMNNLEHFENLINQRLDQATKNINKIGTENINDVENRMMNMINSKSKGNPINVSQMMGSVGQQSVEGKRIMYGFDNRTLPHFTKYDDGPESRGFVENSFIKGLTAQEFFFHAMGGREGLIDTAVKTSETGYIQRKLIKAMEDAKVNFDMTVRNASGSIIQFMYGEDSIDPIKLEKHHLDYLKHNVKLSDLEENYLITEQDNMKYILTDTVIKEMYDTKDWMDRIRTYFMKVIEDREFVIKHVFKNEFADSLYHPIGVTRIIEKIVNMFNLNNISFTSDLSPLYVLDRMEQLIEDLRINKSFPEVKLLSVIVRHYFSPKKLIFHHRFTKSAFDYLVEHFKQKYLEALVHPSEMVGVVAAQSIGEPSTQLTLNSVEYNTHIMVNENGKLKEYKIGEWIENRIDNGDKSSYTYIEKGDQIYVPIGCEEDLKILTCDENGKVFWDNVDAITRHLPINEDGSNTLIRVTLMSGHECTVTKGESVLTRQNNKLLKSKGSELKIGDYLPAMKTLPIPDELKIHELDVSEYISKKDYIFMSEVEKALNIRKEHEKNGNRQWWTNNKGTLFELPYTRSDGFVDAFIGIGDKQGRRTKLENRLGCVYPKGGIYQSCHIPEKFPLDELFGFVIGAYLAEGCLTQYNVLISNNEEKFLNRVEEWANLYGINYHYDEGVKTKGYSKTIRLHSQVLAELFKKMFQQEYIENDEPICVNESDEIVINDIIEDVIYELHDESKKSKRTVKSSSRKKLMPVCLIGAPDTFLKGLVDGYFSGDGTVKHPQKGIEICADSVSKLLLENMSIVLRKFGIYSSIRPSMAAYKNAIKQGYQTTMPYHMSINKHNSIKFANTFSLTIDSKQKRLNEIKKVVYEKDSLTNVVPNVVLSDGNVIDKITINSIDLEQYKNTDDYEIMKSIIESNVFYDKVVKIEEVKSKHSHVFDLTTRNSRNFANKFIVLNDTFHLSGVASASKAVRGVPRIKELLSVSKNIKAPSCTIYLNEKVKTYNDAKIARYSIETTFMKSLVTRSEIYYEPKSDVSTIDNDQSLIDAYNKFKDLNDECMKLVSPWILRLEMDRAIMMDIGLTTLDINLALKKHYGEMITCMFSDDNYNKVIFRIALTDTGITDILTDLKALEYNIMEKIIVSGIDKIKKVSISQKNNKVLNDDEMFRTFVDKEEYMLETDGTNLISVLGNEFVDKHRTISNDVTEINEVLGIEAARQALYNEIDDILNSTTNVNHRHIALLVDTMTCKGYLLSVDRHGINRSDIGPLAKCSFEETADILIKAGVFGEVDRINGVSANIILGQIANCGTGDTKVMMDMSKLHEMRHIDHNTQKDEDEDELTREEWYSGAPCDMSFDYEMNDKIVPMEEKTLHQLKIK